MIKSVISPSPDEFGFHEGLEVSCDGLLECVTFGFCDAFGAASNSVSHSANVQVVVTKTVKFVKLLVMVRMNHRFCS